MSTTDMQVAIDNGRRQEDSFFTARVGKSSSSGTFQQTVPQHFARYHPELNGGNNVTLENASGAKWLVLVLQTHAQQRLRFSKGWRAFAMGNNLRVGDLLIFTQIEDLHFKVTVYDGHDKSVGHPPNPAPAAVEALAPTATACDCRGKALAHPSHAKTEPFSPAAMPLQPPTVAVKPEYPLTQPAVGDSNLAKVILRHISPPPPSGQFPDPHMTATLTEVPVPIQAPTVDRTSTRNVAPMQEQNEMDVAEGNDYMRKSGSKVGMYCTGEQLPGVRIHSSSGKQVVSTPETEEREVNYSMSESDHTDGSMMNRRNYEEMGAQKIQISSATIPFSIRGSRNEVGEISQWQNVQVQGEDSDGEAVRLLRQQGRKNFSDIVCKHRQHDFVSATEKKRALDAAMEFSSQGKDRFVVVICAAQVYRNFYMPVPRHMQVAMGTHGAKAVKAWLTDNDQNLYMVNWTWSGSWKWLMLNKDGWAKFALDHFLEEGDVCVFEHITNSTFAPIFGLLFHVHIFRVEEGHHDSYRTLHTNTLFASQ